MAGCHSVLLSLVSNVAACENVLPAYTLMFLNCLFSGNHSDYVWFRNIFLKVWIV